MTLFIKKKPVKEELVVSASEAQKIYGYFKSGLDETQIFLKYGLPITISAFVKAEIKSLESQIISKMKGSYLLTGEESHFDEETGEKVVDVEAVYFKPTTEVALKNSISSDLLDVDLLVTDVRVWSDGKPDESPTWVDYKNSFN